MPQLFENPNPTIEPGSCTFFYHYFVHGYTRGKEEKERRMKEEEGGGQEGRVRGREGKRGKEKGGERYTFDLEVLCHKTCYVYTAVSRLQEDIVKTQPLLGEG